MVSSEWRMVFLEGRVPANREIFGLTTSDAAVANRQSPIATVSARQEFRPPTFSRPSSRDPRPVKSRRSVFCAINYGLKSALRASVQVR
jgi:hypothetical protein